MFFTFAKRFFFLMSLALVLIFSVAAGGQGESEGVKGVTELELWTFQEVHIEFYEQMAKLWNEEHPDRQIELVATAYPYDEMHNQLLVSLQSGVGAPDIVDIEISRFPNYLKGVPQFAVMNDKVEPIMDELVKGRFEIYAKDEKYYGLPFHVGALVMYYNMDILNKAGVDPDTIETWDDYVEAGKKVKAATGKPMTTIEVTEHWSFWPLISQRGSDFVDENGKIILDNDINIDTLQFLYDMMHTYNIAIPTPGGFCHSEEYYGFMNNGGAASIAMPFWYMNRFTDYMPDLKGKILIRPCPRFTPTGHRSAGMGGTGTVVTNQADDIELAKDFLAFAKLSKEGNILLWQLLGFDPPRWSVWEDPALHEKNKFTDYYMNGTKIFDEVLKVKDEIYPVHMAPAVPDIINIIQSEVMYQVLEDQSKTPREALVDAANQVRAMY
ncbi:ABC transporter substrate-binding protein [Sediminispirochaeta smaragdinae]|uniref:Extracellular solute-binding protein family 1 n=1 Tax=Sediminispirochaeta smaragdinae (strain DSM 11293 / JCM 15392 / SEBR 4228) TaxID=573413 RepID=E1R8K8_SEDSS|nr:extracellular solute-binding protein [Sediminispirochaeta smaragdinae]ADK81765.1 extracellular solute-binding protein family 1 [Sediminispirochaeta smaragdinae DSM 11293]